MLNLLKHAAMTDGILISHAASGSRRSGRCSRCAARPGRSPRAETTSSAAATRGAASPRRSVAS